MNEELLVSPEDEILAEYENVVVSIERDPDPNELHQANMDQVAEVIPVDFGGGPDLTDHMGDTTFDGIEPSNVVIIGPRNTASAGPQARPGSKRLRSDAGTAYSTEIEFSRAA